ncbi:MAG: hypothetical protein ONB46_21245 [candidate division KSB1 bacterium]|nr:hypothetical protein [candidate division KSB1 bacterium]
MNNVWDERNFFDARSSSSPTHSQAGILGQRVPVSIFSNQDKRNAGFQPANEGKQEACAAKNFAVVPALPQARDSFSRVIVMYVCTPITMKM